MRKQKEIKEVLNEEILNYCKERDGESPSLGWIEALCYVLELDTCSCGMPCEENYQQCKRCLDESDRQHENLEKGK